MIERPKLGAVVWVRRRYGGARLPGSEFYWGVYVVEIVRRREKAVVVRPQVGSWTIVVPYRDIFPYVKGKRRVET